MANLSGCVRWCSHMSVTTVAVASVSVILWRDDCSRHWERRKWTVPDGAGWSSLPFPYCPTLPASTMTAMPTEEPDWGDGRAWKFGPNGAVIGIRKEALITSRRVMTHRPTVLMVVLDSDWKYTPAEIIIRKWIIPKVIWVKTSTNSCKHVYRQFSVV